MNMESLRMAELRRKAEPEFLMAFKIPLDKFYSAMSGFNWVAMSEALGLESGSAEEFIGRVELRYGAHGAALVDSLVAAAEHGRAPLAALIEDHPCESCGGRGWVDGAQGADPEEHRLKCPDCNGSGQA